MEDDKLNILVLSLDNKTKLLGMSQESILRLSTYTLEDDIIGSEDDLFLCENEVTIECAFFHILPASHFPCFHSSSSIRALLNLHIFSFEMKPFRFKSWQKEIMSSLKFDYQLLYFSLWIEQPFIYLQKTQKWLRFWSTQPWTKT